MLRNGHVTEFLMLFFQADWNDGATIWQLSNSYRTKMQLNSSLRHLSGWLQSVTPQPSAPKWAWHPSPCFLHQSLTDAALFILIHTRISAPRAFGAQRPGKKPLLERLWGEDGSHVWRRSIKLIFTSPALKARMCSCWWNQPPMFKLGREGQERKVTVKATWSVLRIQRTHEGGRGLASGGDCIWTSLTFSFLITYCASVACPLNSYLSLNNYLEPALKDRCFTTS